MKSFIIIDDAKINNLISRVIISKAYPGAHIVEFTDATEGLRYISEHYNTIDDSQQAILFLDIYMPVMDGWAFLKEYDQLSCLIKNHIKIYMLTSSISKEDIDNANSNPNVLGFVTKPLDESFKAIIDREMSPALKVA